MQKKYFTFFLAVLFCALGQIMADLYLPSLPFIARAYNTSYNAAQFSFALFMLGFAFLQIAYGIYSDKKGRKKPLIAGFFLALLGSLLCLFAPNIIVFNLGRFLQGAGIAASIVLPRAILRDLFSGNDLAKFNSYLEVATNPLIIMTPFLGGFLQKQWGYKASFMVLIFYTLLVLFLSVFFLSETRPQMFKTEDKEKVPQSILQILKNRVFLISSFNTFVTYGGILAWLTCGPIILQNTAGFTPLRFGLASSLIGLSYIPGAFINAKLVRRFKFETLLKFGSVCLLAAGISMAVPCLLGMFGAGFIIFSVVLFIVGAGFILPNCFANAVLFFPRQAGLAAAVLGFLQMLGGFFSSALMSFFAAETAAPLASVFLIYGLLSYFSVNYLSSKKRRTLSED